MAAMYSEEWNATCGQRLPTVRIDAEVGSAYMAFSVFLIVFTSILVPVSFAMFFTARTRWAYVRKRNSVAIVSGGLGVIVSCVVGPIRDLVGREQFSCDVALWFRIFAVVLMCIPLVYMLNFFSDQLMWSKAMSAVSFQKMQELIGDAEVDVKRKSIFYKPRPNRVTDGAAPGSNPDEENASEKASTISGPRMGSGGESVFDEAAFYHAMYKQSYRYKAIVVLVPFVPPIVVGLGFQFGLPYHGHGCVGCVEEPFFIAVITGSVSFFILNIAWMAYSLRDAADPLDILSNLKMMVAVPSVIGMPGLLGVLLDTVIGRPYDRAVFSFDWLITIATVFFFFFLCPAPVLKAYFNSRKVRSGGKMSLKPLLANLQFQKLFAEHLVSEWSIENLKFYNQVNNFRDHYAGFKTSKAANMVAIQTYEMFIKPGAVMEVNISAKQRDKLQEEFKQLMDNSSNSIQIEKTVFDEAQMEILVLMEKDSFARFQSTKKFKEFASANLVVNAADSTMIVAATSN